MTCQNYPNNFVSEEAQEIYLEEVIKILKESKDGCSNDQLIKRINERKNIFIDIDGSWYLFH